MKVLLLNNGSYGHDANVTYPAEVEALQCDGGVDVKVSELKKVGFNFYGLDDTEDLYFYDWEIEVIKQTNGTPCIRDMCCNQFGERDEMQSIINSLQADVIARGARIKTLEDALRATNDELHGAIENINSTLKSNICSTDLDDPDYWDFQTVHDNVMLLRGASDE